MANIKIKLVDNDYVIRSKLDLGWMKEEADLKEFLREVDEELVDGMTAHLEIEGIKKDPVAFEISKSG